MIVAVDAELADLIPRYLANRQADLAFAREMLDQGDYVLIAALAHRLKGNAASYGFAGLSEIAVGLEQAANGRDIDAMISQLAAYEAFLATLHIEYV